MPRGNQPAADGRLQYRLMRDGTMRRAAADDAGATPRIEVGERFVVATLRGDRLDVRIGCTATVDGRPVNREYELADDDLGDILKAMTVLLEEAGDHAEEAVLRDARQIAEDDR